jgi:heat-inducible transcriptional repressor
MSARTKYEELNERDRSVLRHIVQYFILTANPVGSRYLAKHCGLNLSPATIRNLMADLEERGYLNHPHTSAGRVPTDKGYRVYVDMLMELEQLSGKYVETIEKKLEKIDNREELLTQASDLLGTISSQLSIVTNPQLASGRLERLEMVSLSSNRIMVIITVKSGIIKTLVMEIRSAVSRNQLDAITQVLNERLNGLTLKQIRETFSERVRDVQNEETGLIRLFVDSVDDLFDDAKERDRLFISGTRDILNQPEFNSPERIRSVIELIDDKEIIIHVLENRGEKGTDLTVSIGKENPERQLKNYSVISTRYLLGDIHGTVSVIGPKRMNYSRIIPLVDYIAKTISQRAS